MLQVDDVVMVQVRSIAEMGAYVSLLEYGGIEGMILLSELSRRRIRSVQKLVKVGRQEPVMVLRVDKEKGYIDLSKRRVSPEDLAVRCLLFIYFYLSCLCIRSNPAIEMVFPCMGRGRRSMLGDAADTSPHVIFGREKGDFSPGRRKEWMKKIYVELFFVWILHSHTFTKVQWLCLEFF